MWSSMDQWQDSGKRGIGEEGDGVAWEKMGREWRRRRRKDGRVVIVAMAC